MLLATALVAGYGVFAIARGFLAGGHRYEAYGVATAAESLARILLAAAVLMLITDGIGLALVMVVAPLAVLAVRPFRRTGIGASAAEPAAGTEPGADVLVGDAGHFLAPMVLANGASQTVLGAGPLVVAALGASPATVSAVFVTFTLFRGPLWMVQSVLARVLPPFTALARRHEHQALRRWALRLAAMGALLSGFAYPVGWWLGPDVVSLLFGRQFAPSAALAALVATGTALAAVTLFASQILVAEGRAGRICAAWGLALVVAAVALRLPGAADMRVGLSFLAGEITAFVLVTAFAARSTSGSPRLRYSTVVEKVRA